MNSQLIQQGRAAYRAGDFSAAAQMLGAAKTPDEIMGEADHLRGNALMHLACMPRPPSLCRRPQRRHLRQARRAAHQPRQGARRRGRLHDGRPGVLCRYAGCFLCHAVQGLSGPGQCAVPVGRLCQRGYCLPSGCHRRRNPAPAAALGELGRCFIKLGRPADAVETYRTAIDFAGPATTRVRSTPAWVRRFLPPAVPPTHSTPLTPLLPMASTSHLRAGR